MSALAVNDIHDAFGDPFDGILGLDFFAGRVVEIDYPHGRVRLLSREDATAAFSDPKAIVAANVDQGMPLVAATVGTAAGESFVVDTGSPRVFVMDAFVTRNADAIRTWPKTRPAYVVTYLEGGIEVQPSYVPSLALGAYRFDGMRVGMQIPTKLTDDITFPFDGIIGTDVLRSFVVDFDYDGGRIALHRVDGTPPSLGSSPSRSPAAVVCESSLRSSRRLPASPCLPSAGLQAP